jgi:hypothetical protein
LPEAKKIANAIVEIFPYFIEETEKNRGHPYTFEVFVISSPKTCEGNCAIYSTLLSDALKLFGIHADVVMARKDTMKHFFMKYKGLIIGPSRSYLF